MLINLSNHPSTFWKEEQKKAAVLYGKVVDLPFPEVDPEKDEAYIDLLANEQVQKILTLSSEKDITVHLMGEMTLTVAILKRVQALNITCIASTTRRMVKEDDNGHKELTFKFERFRKYS
jgi:hypothetical protein